MAKENYFPLSEIDTQYGASFDHEHGEETEHRERQREVLIVGHTYQPPREVWLPSQQKRFFMVPEVNAHINDEVYRHLFETTENTLFDENYSIPEGIYSYWAPLRDWKMSHDPEGFEKTRLNIEKMEDKEYKILGDTYLHVIMPLQTEEDQRMLAEIGKEAFVRDFGFAPKGVWVAETGISSTTLRILHGVGYKFVVLRDNQIMSSEHNPMYIPVRDQEGNELGEIAIIHFNSGLSGAVSFQDRYTENADSFLEDQRIYASGDITIGSDTELYGHHKKGRQWWRRWVTRSDVLSAHGFSPFNIKARLADSEHTRTEIIENSSWSCDHELGRWTGNCNCDNPTWEALNDKKEFYNALTEYGLIINQMLNQVLPDWREKFKAFFLGVRKTWFGDGDVEQNIDDLILSDTEGLSILGDTKIRRLFEAKMCELVGKTSCGWFFPKVDTPERELPRAMIREIETLIPQIRSSREVSYQHAA